MKLWDLCQSQSGTSAYEQAQNLQQLITAADGVALKLAIPGMKMIMNRLFGFGANPRLPIMPISKDKGDAVMSHPDLQILLAF